MKSIGERIRTLRIQRGMTSKALAEAVGISPSTLSELESGESKSTTKLHRIAAVLDVEPSELDPPKGRRSQSDALRHPTNAQRQQVIDPVNKYISTGSRVLRLDADTVRSGVVVLHAFFTDCGGAFDPEADGDLLLAALEWAQRPDDAGQQDLHAAIEERVRNRGGAKHEKPRHKESKRSKTRI